MGWCLHTMDHRIIGKSGAMIRRGLNDGAGTILHFLVETERETRAVILEAEHGSALPAGKLLIATAQKSL
ncbi:MAG: hypothetical protein RL693_2348 [Verrucomicrobiota bacterium]